MGRPGAGIQAAAFGEEGFGFFARWDFHRVLRLVGRETGDGRPMPPSAVPGLPSSFAIFGQKGNLPKSVRKTAAYGKRYLPACTWRHDEPHRVTICVNRRWKCCIF